MSQVRPVPVSVRTLLAAMLLAVLVPTPAQADVKLPAVFSDHMVLQRGTPLPVWGTAAPNEKVTVQFRDQTQSTTAGADGKWSVKLTAVDVGEPGTLVITAANTVTISDVLVGEVWVGSGQSNMDGDVNGYRPGDAVLAKLAAAEYPKLRLCFGANGKWQVANEQTINPFSALLFAFGQRLQEELGVPVGLIEGAVGGTPSGRWLTDEMLAADAAAQEAIQKYAAANPYEERLAQHQKALAAWKVAAAKAKAEGAKPPPQPAAPFQAGAIQSGRAGDLYTAHLLPVVPYAIRGVLWDQGESGTALTGVNQYLTMGAMIRGWRQAWGLPEFPFLYVQKPSGGGCAWDPADPVTVRAEAFTKLPAAVPGDGHYREEHVRIKDYPYTAMVASRDLGSGVHPVNKSGYGHRAARVALGLVYQKPVAISGPVYESHAVEGNKVRIKFRHVGKGLAWRHGERLQGFAVAGEDRVFRWASAEIDGDRVVVTCAEVAQPVAVRYAWANQSPWANLFNQDGLPTVEFRTDGW